MWERLSAGDANGLDLFITASTLFLVAALAILIRFYVKGLKGSPRELYLALFTKFTEFIAFASAILASVLFLNHDVGLGDLAAGAYVGWWMVLVSALSVVVGSVCDVIGIKRTLLVGCFALLLGRFFLPLLDDLASVTALGFFPLAFGVAITGPVLLVAVQRYTTPAGATLAFGLFYSLMNLSFAIGGWVFDFIRGIFGDFSVAMTLPLVGDVSVYQMIFAVGFVLTLPDLIAISLMRNNVEMTESGVRFAAELPSRARNTISSIGTMMATATRDTARNLGGVVREKRFWVFLGMLGIVVFTRMVTYFFLFTFPTYGIRVFGEGARVGNMHAVLNPMIIVFLAPLFAIATARVSSYKMLLLGCSISAVSVWLATVPAELFAPLVDTGFGELIYDRWLAVPAGQWDPLYLAFVIFVAIFSIGEAIWMPRLLQFTVEIAPPGKEGSYAAFSYLPHFGAQILAGPMSGLLLATYVPRGEASYPDHSMVWVWIGLMAAVTPVGMLVFGRVFRRAEHNSAAERSAG